MRNVTVLCAAVLSMHASSGSHALLALLLELLLSLEQQKPHIERR